MPREKIDLDEFRALRHRYYKLGKARRWDVLRHLGLLGPDEEPLDQNQEKDILLQIAENSGITEIEEWVTFYEKEIEEESKLKGEGL
jgi:hypothetical protein